MGSTSQVTSCDLFICEMGKGFGVGRECPGHSPGNRSNLSLETRAGLGKGWRREATLISGARDMEVCPVSPCGYSCTPLQSLESLESLGMKLFGCSFFLYPW